VLRRCGKPPRVASPCNDIRSNPPVTSCHWPPPEDVFLAKRATENEHAIRFSSIQLEDNLAFVQIDYSIIELGLSFWAVSKLVDSKQIWSYPPSQSLPWQSLIITSLVQKTDANK
jgi:hypothetical protein